MSFQTEFVNGVKRASVTNLLVAVACLSIATLAADAQIGRSRPPSPPSTPPSSSGGQGGRTPSGGSSSSSGSTPRTDRGSRSDSSSSSSPRSDRGRTPDTSSVDSGSGGNERGGQKSVDRYSKTKESAAAKGSGPQTAHIHYYPTFPWGYDPYGPGPYGYPTDSYPYPDPRYPSPRDRSISVARYDSPYIYCQDLPTGRYVDGPAVIIAKPKRMYTPTPIIKNGEVTGWRDLGADDYLADRNAESTDYRVREQQKADPALDAAVDDIRASWTTGDVEPLARHLRRDTNVSIVLDGKYLYSLEAGDLLEVTNAAYGSVKNLRFVADHLHRRAEGIYTLTGRHLFTDNKGNERTVYFSYVLVKQQNDYTVAQLASAADRN